MNFITIEAVIFASVSEVWDASINPEKIKKWNTADSETWHCPHAENDLVENGRFSYTMAAKDGSFEFNFSGFFTEIIPENTLKYTLDDGRKFLKKKRDLFRNLSQKIFMIQIFKNLDGRQFWIVLKNFVKIMNFENNFHFLVF